MTAKRLRLQVSQFYTGLTLLLCFVTPVHAVLDKKVYQLSVVPQFTSLELQRRWVPVTKFISKKTGLEVRLKLHRDIPAFEKALLNGEPDIAYMNPYHYMMTQKTSNPYEAMLRDSSKQLVGILVVPASSEVKTVQDLQNATIAFPAPNAFAASLYIRALLRSSENIDFKAHYVGTHSNAYRHVVYKKADAAGGVMRSYKSEAQRLQDKLRIIYKTPGVAPHPLAISSGVREVERKKIIKAIYMLMKSKEGQALLRNAGIKQPIRADHARDYAILDSLELEKYVEQ